MDLSQNVFMQGKSRYLTEAEKAAFAERIEAIRDSVMQTLGEKDARYVYRVRDLVRYTEIVGRSLLMFGGKSKLMWVMGTVSLGISKIVENMELGHNVMHGQYDWLNDPTLHGSSYEWDNVCAGLDWKRTHNFEHHTYTNVMGRDRDIGYGLLRMTREQPWQWHDVFNLPSAAFLALFFEWGVGIHGLHLTEEAGTKSTSLKKLRSPERKKHAIPFLKKMSRQLAKDFVLFPALAGRRALPVFAGNFAANTMRNIWAFGVIFCGHFSEDVEIFPDNIENETRADWYLRQIKGSCNIDGGKLMHFFTGNLSHQIEHHLFPDMPANRYAEVAPKVQALCAEYGQHYDTGTMRGQLKEVFKRIAQHSVPDEIADRIWKNASPQR